MGGAEAAGAGPWGCGLDWSQLGARLDKLMTMAKHGQGRRHGWGPHGWGGHGFGPGAWRGPGGPFAFFGGGPPGWMRPPKAKRGDVRAAVLALLAEEPRNGYQIIQEIHERSGGAWKPSPGAVYPALQQLADEGLVWAEEAEGRRTFHLTDAGQVHVDDRGDEIGTPWEEMAYDPGAEVSDLFKIAAQCSSALMQVVQTGDEQHVEQAREVLVDTRRRLYRILAEDDLADDERG